MLDKVFYFKVGKKDIRVAWPKETMNRAFATVFAVMFVVDVLGGALLAAFLMAMMFGLYTVEIK